MIWRNALQLGQLAFIAHWAHHGEAVAIGKQGLDGFPYLFSKTNVGWKPIQLPKESGTQQGIKHPKSAHILSWKIYLVISECTLFLASTADPCPETDLRAVSRYSLGVSCTFIVVNVPQCLCFIKNQAIVCLVCCNSVHRPGGTLSTIRHGSCQSASQPNLAANSTNMQSLGSMH